MFLILGLIVLGMSIYLNFYIKKAFQEGNKTSLGISGGELLNNLKVKYNINNLDIEEIDGVLTDHFMPSENKIRLSKEVYNGTGISSLAVALHEFGHYIQHEKKSTLTKLHSIFFPFINIFSIGGIVLFLVGNSLSFLSLSFIGIFLFTITTIYYLLLSIVEYDASEIGYGLFLENFEYASKDDKFLFKKMLFIAFLTYFLSLVQSIIQLIEMIYSFLNSSQEES